MFFYCFSNADDRKLIMKELAYVRQQNDQTLNLLNRSCERPQLNMVELNKWSFPLKCGEDLGRLEDSLQENKDLECILHGRPFYMCLKFPPHLLFIFRSSDLQ